MAITLNGTTGITTDGGYTGDGVTFADGTPSNTLVTTTGGNVGIGTSTPSNFDSTGRKLVVGTGSGDQGMTIYSGSSNANVFFASGTSGSQLYNGFLQYQNSGNNMLFGTGGTERMRIDSSGNLIVGTTSSGGKVTSQNSGNTLAFSAQQYFNGQTVPTIQSSCYTAAGTGWYHFVGQSGNGSTVTTNNVLIYGNGNIVNSNNSYGAMSDVKLKENIVDAKPKLEQLCQVKVRNYNLIGDTNKQLGVVAQELEQIFPSMIEESPDRDIEGNELGTTTKSVKYSVFVPMLIKAIQEQQAIITDLKARIETLENK